MTNTNDDVSEANSPSQQKPGVFGSGSVAHQVIGQFLLALRKTEGYEGISDRLSDVVFDEKVTELKLRKAMLGEEPL